MLVLLSAVCLGVQNVVIRVMFAQSLLLNTVPIGGWFSPGVPNSLLLLQVRTLITLVLLLPLLPWLYPNIGSDLRQFCQKDNRSLQWDCWWVGTSLFGALALLYLAIANLPAGIAITIFFIYPAVTAVLAWFILGDRPSVFLLWITGLMLAGVGLTAPDLAPTPSGSPWLGVGAAIAASVAYGLYGTLTQRCVANMHPVTLSLLAFVILLVWTSGSLLLVPIDLPVSLWWPLIWTSTLCAVLSGGGHILSVLGIRAMGITSAFLVSATMPLFTLLTAWLAIAEVLQPRQLLGVALVLLGVLALGIVRLRARPARLE